MKLLYKWLAYVISSFVILRFCVPTLISMADTVANIFGFGLLLAWGLITLKLVFNYAQKKAKTN